MSDFVHLHLHSQYSLLDGANRIDDVIDGGQGRGHAGAGPDRPRQPVRRHRVLRQGEGRRASSRSSASRPTSPQGSHTDRDASAGEQQPPGAPGARRDRLPEPDQAHLRVVSRGLLLQAAHRPRAAAAALRRPDRALGLPQGRDQRAHHGRPRGGGRGRGRGCTARSSARATSSSSCRTTASPSSGRQRGAAAAGAQARAPAGGDQRLPLPAQGRRLRARRPALHRHPAHARGPRPPAATPRQSSTSRPATRCARSSPTTTQALENTLAIAERCNLDHRRRTSSTCPSSRCRRERRVESLLRAGGRARGSSSASRSSGGANPAAFDRHPPEVYRERLRYEIEVIERMGFPGYFLIVWDFIRHARENGIPVGPGRGSAAGSLVSYALRITDIDPAAVRPAVRALPQSRAHRMPDIDIDFCMRRRGEVIQYVGEKYGRDRVAQIITFGTLAAKAVIRDVGRVMGLPFAKVDRIAKLLPGHGRSRSARPPRTSKRSSAEIDTRPRGPADRRGRQPPRRADPPRLGARRRRGDHAARRWTSSCRSTRPTATKIVTQWDMKVVERLGLLKMDFLGLRTLTVIDDTLKILQLSRASSSTSTRCRSTIPRPSASSATAAPTASSSSSRRGMTRPAAPRPALALRGPRGVQRPLPAGRALGRHGRRVHPAQAGQEERALHPARDQADPGGDLRRHRLPGAGDADRRRRRRLHHGRGRRAAQGDGQEERRGDGQAEGEVRRRRREARRGRGARPRSCGTTSSPSPATASTRATAWPTPCSPTRPPTSRPTIRWPSWRPC